MSFDATHYDFGVDMATSKEAVTPSPKGRAVLMGYLTAEKCLQWSQVDDDVLKHSILETLSEACGGASWPHEENGFE